jgi:RNA polymerase sigma-70 factor (ECF subfamily)
MRLALCVSSFPEPVEGCLFNATITFQGTIRACDMSKVMTETGKEIKDDDHQLVLSCKAGDIDAFEELVRKHEKKMLNIAYRMIGNYEEACEIVQDAFLAVYRNIIDFKGTSRFSTWLYAIVMNLSKNRLKQIQARGRFELFSTNNPVATDTGTLAVEPASNDPTALELLENKDVQQTIQECINKLDEEFRSVLVLRDIQGFSYNEISDMLSIASGTVKSRLFRARDAVKSCLKKALGGL